MNLRHLLWGGAALSAGLLLYGGLVEAHRLHTMRRTLRLRGWPARLDGYKVVLLADAHVRSSRCAAFTRRAVELALAESPDLVVIPGDTISYWKRGVLELVEEAYAPLAAMAGRVIAVPGNHDYFAGDAAWLGPTFDRLGIRFLRNEVARIDDVNWVGVDSELSGHADPYTALRLADPADPIVVVWHEPDMVERLPRGPELMLSGHSHGGQFIAPWGWAPAKTVHGRRYIRGFYPDAPVPIYVSQGLGTTGPPSRLFCPPELSVLTLRSLAR